MSPQLHLQGNDLPTIDVLITTCREENTIILNSVRAACESDWPQDKFRVIIADDGRDEVLASQITLLQQTYPQLHYTSRSKPSVPDYKAGNLNHAIAFQPSTSDLIAGLDADMIVQPHWLRCMVPHILSSDKIAMVCSHQVRPLIQTHLIYLLTRTITALLQPPPIRSSSAVSRAFLSHNRIHSPRPRRRRLHGHRIRRA
jgi:cellulose synthase/poly-beta-1,6-N-acetylglucosamine synthase-like glycosyltransferase